MPNIGAIYGIKNTGFCSLTQALCTVPRELRVLTIMGKQKVGIKGGERKAASQLGSKSESRNARPTFKHEVQTYGDRQSLKEEAGDRGKNRPYSFPGAAVTTVTNGGACNNRNIFCPGCGAYVWIAGGKAMLPLSIGRESFLPSLLAFFDSQAHPLISVSVTARWFLCVSPLPHGNLLSMSISEFFSSSCKDTSHLGFRAHPTPVGPHLI